MDRTEPINHSFTTPLLLESARCSFCDSDRAKTISGPFPDVESGEDAGTSGLAFRMGQCEACDLVYLRERPVMGEVPRLYSGTYHCFKPFGRRGRIMSLLSRLVAARKIRQLQQVTPASHPTLLDYGCGSGTWLELMRAKLPPAWQFMGTDIIPAQIQLVRNAGLEGFVCDETTLLTKVGAGTIGAVHLFHVIEHVANPQFLLEQLFLVLAPGGAIVGQTPNHACWDRRLFGVYWNQWHFPRHFSVFSRETLVQHAQRAGFEVVRISNSLSSATQWAASLLKVIRVKQARPFRPAEEPIYPLLILLFLPLTILQSLVSRTSHMDFIFRKPG